MSRLLQALCLHGPQLGLYVGANLLHLLEEVDLQVGEAVVLHRLVVPLLCQVDQHLVGSLRGILVRLVMHLFWGENYKNL